MILFPTTQKIAFGDGLNPANTGSTSGSCLNSSDSKIYFVDGLNSTNVGSTFTTCLNFSDIGSTFWY